MSAYEAGTQHEFLKLFNRSAFNAVLIILKVETGLNMPAQGKRLFSISSSLKVILLSHNIAERSDYQKRCITETFPGLGWRAKHA